MGKCKEFFDNSNLSKTEAADNCKSLVMKQGLKTAINYGLKTASASIPGANIAYAAYIAYELGTTAWEIFSPYMATKAVEEDICWVT